mmetsp:Transcript_35693/g.84570  ORF Transcript_35693/g.84570 Transcript_35693/m.84570 type:complete len:213 (+) Transcript_35693:2881-3519(+)
MGPRVAISAAIPSALTAVMYARYEDPGRASKTREVSSAAAAGKDVNLFEPASSYVSTLATVGVSLRLLSPPASASSTTIFTVRSCRNATCTVKLSSVSSSVGALGKPRIHRGGAHGVSMSSRHIGAKLPGDSRDSAPTKTAYDLSGRSPSTEMTPPARCRIRRLPPGPSPPPLTRSWLLTSVETGPITAPGQQEGRAEEPGGSSGSPARRTT